MTNTQILFQFVGWAFLFFLSNRTIKRTEISRLKDQLVVQVEELTTWLKSELENDEGSALTLERAYTGKVTRLDLLLQQLNRLAKRKVIDENILFPFWNLDVYSVYSTKKICEIKVHQQDAVEKIEISYHSLFKLSMVNNLFLHYKPEIFGVLFATWLLFFYYCLMLVLFS